MKALLLFTVLLSTAFVQAAELVITSGTLAAQCQKGPSDEELIEEARQEAIKKLDNLHLYVQYSEWRDGVDYFRYAGACRARNSIAYASFIKKSEFDEELYVTLESFSSWVKLGRDLNEEDISNQRQTALKNNLAKADFYCKGRSEIVPSSIEYSQEESVNHIAFRAKAKYQCI